MKNTLPMLRVLSLGGVGMAQAPPVGQVGQEQWYVVLNGEDRMGYMHTTRFEKDGVIHSRQSVKLVMGRAGAEVSIEVESGFAETPQGVPVEATSKINMGGMPMTSVVRFDGFDGPVEIVTGQAGRNSSSTRPAIEGKWFPPAAMQRYVQEQLTHGAQTISARTVDVSMGLTPIDMSMTVLGREEVEVYGKTVSAIVWEASVSAMPGITMREYVDDRGESIKTTMALMPGLELTVLQADKALALSELEPAEMMAATFVTPRRKIERPRELTGAVYRLQLNDGQALSVPQLGTQVITARHDDGAAELTVVMWPQDAERLAPGHLEASAVLNHEDPAVQADYQMARRSIAAKDVSSYKLALGLRSFVHQTIQTKDLSVGFATASDVARTKQGDCTEHAVYLAALLRAAGIPSRCVSGLIYADQFAGHEGIFGYHMWTQGWIADDPRDPDVGRWVDFDATLPGGVRFDATHIAISVSDMNQGLIDNDMAALVPLLGNLDIEVLETSHGPAVPE